MPIYGTLKYDGFGNILHWPSLFYWFAGIGGGLLLLGCRLLILPQRVGAEVSFETDGFILRVRRFFRQDIDIRLTWFEIEEMKLVEAPRGGDYVSFRLTYDAAVKHALIEPTTRYTASKRLVKREIPFPPRLSGVSATEAVARFHTSAKQAGVKLAETQSLNVVVFVRKVWSVTHQ